MSVFVGPAPEVRSMIPHLLRSPRALRLIALAADVLLTIIGGTVVGVRPDLRGCDSPPRRDILNHR
jgi:hypothetical protein